MILLRMVVTSTLLFACLIGNTQQQIKYSYDLQSRPVNYKHYWKSTGYSPGSMTTTDDFQLYLNMIKAMKGEALEYIRPHFLLNHVEIIKPGTAQQAYKWGELDEILDLLIEADLKLIFEIMMSPHPYFNDWYDRNKLNYWKEFCKALVLHLQERYGQVVVRQWYFESINEPDIGYWWPYGPLQFLHYYDATAQGVVEADSMLRFGGPGAAFGRSTVYEVFIDHINDGINFYTGKRDVKCDFISWHRKATPHKMIDAEQELNAFVEEQGNDIMSSLPVGNDEADPIAGWGKEHWWRPDPWYAAFVVQSVDLHNQFFVDKKEKDYFVLSNDNAFMGDWYRRTHVARFSFDSSYQEEKQFYLVKKPVMTAMSLLAIQGDKRFIPENVVSDSSAGVIVSSNMSGEYIILAYNKPEIEITSETAGFEPNKIHKRAIYAYKRKIELSLKNMTAGEYKMIKYRIDNTHGNPFGTWQSKDMGDSLTYEDWKILQAEENPVLIGLEDININDNLTLRTSFESSGVELVYLARRPKNKPFRVKDIEYHLYDGLNGDRMVMLNWKHVDPIHIKSFDVYYAPEGSKQFIKVNDFDVLDQGFLYLNETIGGRYKIMAVDYWGRKSSYSETVHITE